MGIQCLCRAYTEKKGPLRHESGRIDDVLRGRTNLENVIVGARVDLIV